MKIPETCKQAFILKQIENLQKVNTILKKREFINAKDLMPNVSLEEFHTFYWSESELQKLKTITTSVLYTWDETEPTHDTIELLNWMSKEVGFATARVVGPTSVISVGDKILLSRRVVSSVFTFAGVEMRNTADNSVLAFVQDGEVKATGKVVLYTWDEPEQEVTASGIILAKSVKSKEQETRWGTVVAAGKEADVKTGDKILLVYNNDAYKITCLVPGKEVMNCFSDNIIAFVPKAHK